MFYFATDYCRLSVSTVNNHAKNYKTANIKTKFKINKPVKLKQTRQKT